MTDTTQTPAVASRVTLDDVRAVLNGTDLHSTNASKVRTLLGGRGSFETIQKHLNTLRAELAAAAAPPVAADQVPVMPADAAQAMWVAAWTAAQVQTLRRTELLAAERDAALLKLETMSQDLADQVQTMDAQAGELERAAAAVAAVQAAHLADLEKSKADLAVAAADRAQVVQELERARQELAKVQADAAHAAEIAAAGRELMRQELARLTDQLGELKAALYKRAEAPPAVVVNPSPAG
jgi:DNA repair exonuclease SbcCD ATPase subunit